MPAWLWSHASTSTLEQSAAIAALFLLFLLVMAVFIPSGQLLGRQMSSTDNRFQAYSLNVLGSLAGVFGFCLVSYLTWPPLAWFLVAMLLGVLLLRGSGERVSALIAVLAVVALLPPLKSGESETVWSPYQKLTFKPERVTSATGEVVATGFAVQVNEAFYQRASNLSPEFLGAHPDLFPEWSYATYIGYDLAYRLQDPAREVLVVGAGTGNDVAAALRNGAEHVDAVEIDPTIIAVGRRLHPEQPYSDARVAVHIDDARSFFKKTERRYDLIVFGALDSHSLNAAMSSLRLDNYVYTVESFREARALLKPGGVVWLLFAYERWYIANRISAMLQEAFGTKPAVFGIQDVRRLSPAGGGTVFTVDLEGRIHDRIGASSVVGPQAAAGAVQLSGEVILPTDDWPYLYLSTPGIPPLHLVVVSGLILLVLLMVKPFVGEFARADLHFFGLGAGFLLVEVQSINRMCLLFGNTWNVNTVVISSILVMVLLSYLLGHRLGPSSLRFSYLGLALSLMLSYRFPLHELSALPTMAKVIAAGLVTGLPLVFAGLVFIVSFARTPNPDAALGSNLLGAVIGGACESLSFVIGINALILVGLLFYTLSFLTLFFQGRLSLRGGIATG